MANSKTTLVCPKNYVTNLMSFYYIHFITILNKKEVFCHLKKVVIKKIFTQVLAAGAPKTEHQKC